MTLTEFLLARIAEDEEEFRARPSDDLAAASADLNEGWIVLVSKRMRAECAAKRRIVTLHPIRYAVLYDERKRLAAEDAGEETVKVEGWSGPICDAELCALGAIYSDHPDYRQEWKP